jgi:pimeloyl-ACP methyl ester carboxylesterase
MTKKSFKLSTIVLSATLSISALLGLSSMSERTNLIAGPNNAHAMKTNSKPENLLSTKFKSEKIDGLTIAYREAGDPRKPKVLLLHGFPTSSHMFRNLIPHLAKDYHVIAPDYPGYGASSMPTVDKFDYTFDNISNVIEKLLERKNINRYAVYLMDYGAPVGYRLFAKNPKQVSGFIIQNGNAYEEGLSDFWKPLKAYWKTPSKENADKLRGFLKLDATKWQYLHGVKNPEKISPDNFWHVQYLLNRPGNQEIQLKLFLDYGTNLQRYPHWQKLFRKHQPPVLIVWGKNDPIFPESCAHPYKRDLKTVDFNLLETGHFALEDHGNEIAEKILSFLKRIN